MGGWLLGLLLVASGGCSSFHRAEPEGLRVAVAIEPIAFLVERLAGPYAQVQVLIPPGADAHTFQLSPRQLADLAQADLFVRVGLALEDRILEKLREHRANLPLVNLAEAIAYRRFLSTPEDSSEGAFPFEQGVSAHAHSLANASQKSTPSLLEGGELAGQDPHIWLSPPLLKEQAKRIAQALAEHDPAHAHHYRRNLTQLESELDALHAWIRQKLAPYRGRTFLVFHPSFGYFADCYGLRQLAVQQEAKPPTPQALRHLIQQAQAQTCSIILVQPQFDLRSARVVAEAVGAQLVEINDLERNVPQTLKKLTEVLVEAFANPAPQPPSSSSLRSVPIGYPIGPRSTPFLYRIAFHLKCRKPTGRQVQGKALF